jgi:hypothetical protein
MTFHPDSGHWVACLLGVILFGLVAALAMLACCL